VPFWHVTIIQPDTLSDAAIPDYPTQQNFNFVALDGAILGVVPEGICGMEK
jgi:hypothetical protein